MKKIFFIFIYSVLAFAGFSEGSKNVKNFIRGNINDKISAVRSAGDDELAELSSKAIDFSLENKVNLGNDRELDALAVAGILSLPSNYLSELSDSEKQTVSSKLYRLYNDFYNENVKIAVLSKLCQGNIPSKQFSDFLNNLMVKENLLSYSPNFVKAVINTLGVIGESSSFSILYDCYGNSQWENFKPELENSISLLAPKSYSEIITITRSGNVKDCQSIFNLIVKNEKNPENLRAQIAENILSSTIYIVEGKSSADKDVIALQIDAMKVLADCNWTRSSKTVISFYKTALAEYKKGLMNQDQFVSVIGYAAETAPMDAVALYSDYLMKLNKDKESGTDVSEKVVLALIDALGAIGDKNAFDSLLSVTYYNYSDTVITRARSALAGLKW